MSRSVPTTEQGLLQGAMASVMTGAAIVGPLLANGSFAVAISPDLPLSLPGAPFFLGSILCLVALLLARRGMRHVEAQPAVIHPMAAVEALAA